MNINIGGDKKESISRLHNTDFANLMGQNLSLDAHVTSRLGEWPGSKFGVICEWVDLCNCTYKERPVGQRIDLLVNNVLCGLVIP